MNDFNDNAKEIKKKAGDLYNTAKEQASNAYYETKPKADELAEQVSNTASDLYESGKQGLGQAEGYVEEYIACMAQSVRKQPITSVLLAAGVGYIFAKFIK